MMYKQNVGLCFEDGKGQNVKYIDDSGNSIESRKRQRIKSKKYQQSKIKKCSSDSDSDDDDSNIKLKRSIRSEGKGKESNSEKTESTDDQNNDRVFNFLNKEALQIKRSIKVKSKSNERHEIHKKVRLKNIF